LAPLFHGAAWCGIRVSLRIEDLMGFKGLELAGVTRLIACFPFCQFFWDWFFPADFKCSAA